MRAYQLVECQRAPVLRDVLVAKPGPGQVLLRVGAAGVPLRLHIMEFAAGVVPWQPRLGRDRATKVPPQPARCERQDGPGLQLPKQEEALEEAGLRE